MSIPSSSFAWNDVMAIEIVTGGLGSVSGAAIGALFIGFARTIAIFYAPQLELFIVFFVMAIILSFKPEGLFGSKGVRKI